VEDCFFLGNEMRVIDIRVMTIHDDDGVMNNRMFRFVMIIFLFLHLRIVILLTLIISIRQIVIINVTKIPNKKFTNTKQAKVFNIFSILFKHLTFTTSILFTPFESLNIIMRKKLKFLIL
jgi:hypothetical protein